MKKALYIVSDDTQFLRAKFLSPVFIDKEPRYDLYDN